MVSTAVLRTLGFAAAVSLARGASGAGTSTNESNETLGDKAGHSKVNVDVLGQSGKFNVYAKGQGANTGVQVIMDALYERDKNGDVVGASGSMDDKHSIQNFATQNFTIVQPMMVDLGGVQANKISFSSPVSTVGRIRVDTYVMAHAGLVGPPGESWKVSAGDLKWNIALEGWKWCGCQKGKKTEVGDFVDLHLSVKSMSGGNSSIESGGSRVGLGGGLHMELSKQVEVDGVWQAMPEGYPRVTASGSTTTLIFRFPKFNTKALYDPVVTGFTPEVDGAGSRVSGRLAFALAFVALGMCRN